MGLLVSASGQRRLYLEHLGCGYSNLAHTHATINKQMFVLHAAIAVLWLDQNIDEMCETIKLTKHVIIAKLIPPLVPF